MPKITYTDLHIHSEFSLQDGMIKIADDDDPKHIKTELIEIVEKRGTGAVTITDHGNMYGHASLASVCRTFGRITSYNVCYTKLLRVQPHDRDIY